MKTSDFYTISGTIEKAVFEHHSPASVKSQTLHLFLENKNGYWIYNSDQPNYYSLVHSLKNCSNISLIFKKSEYIEHQSGTIWHADLCGKTVIDLKKTVENKKNINVQNHYYIKIVLFSLLLLFLFFILFLSIRMSHRNFQLIQND